MARFAGYGISDGILKNPARFGEFKLQLIVTGQLVDSFGHPVGTMNPADWDRVRPSGGRRSGNGKCQEKDAEEETDP